MDYRDNNYKYNTIIGSNYFECTVNYVCKSKDKVKPVSFGLWVCSVEPPPLLEEFFPAISPKNMAPLVASSAGVSKLMALYCVFLACIWRGASCEQRIIIKLVNFQLFSHFKDTTIIIFMTYLQIQK